MARLESGSIDWYKYTEKADKIYRKYVEASTEDEKIYGGIKQIRS